MNANATPTRNGVFLATGSSRLPKASSFSMNMGSILSAKQVDGVSGVAEIEADKAAQRAIGDVQLCQPASACNLRAAVPPAFAHQRLHLVVERDLLREPLM